MPSIELLQESIKVKQDFRQFVFQLLREPGRFKYFDEKNKEGVYVLNFDRKLVQSLFPKFKCDMTVVCTLNCNNVLFKQVL